MDFHPEGLLKGEQKQCLPVQLVLQSKIQGKVSGYVLSSLGALCSGGVSTPKLLACESVT